MFFAYSAHLLFFHNFFCPRNNAIFRHFPHLPLGGCAVWGAGWRRAWATRHEDSGYIPFERLTDIIAATVQKQEIKHRVAQSIEKKMKAVVAALMVLVHEIILLLVMPPKWSITVPVVRSLIFLCVCGASPLLLPYVEALCEPAPDAEVLSLFCKSDPHGRTNTV